MGMSDLLQMMRACVACVQSPGSHESGLQS